MWRTVILIAWMLPLLHLASCRQDGRSSVKQGRQSAAEIHWGLPVAGLRLGISCAQEAIALERTALLGLHVQNVGDHGILFPRLAALTDRQFCAMLEVSVDGRVRAWGPPATPGPVGPDVFIELPPGEIVSVKREFFASSRWFHRAETAQLRFHVNSENFRQAAEAKKAEGVAPGLWSGHAHSGGISLWCD